MKVSVDSRRRPPLSMGMLSVIGYLALLGLFVFIRVRWVPRPENEGWADPLMFAYLIVLIVGLISLSWSSMLFISLGAILLVIFLWVIASEGSAMIVRSGDTKYRATDLPTLQPQPIGTDVENPFYRGIIWLSVRRTWTVRGRWTFQIATDEGEHGLPAESLTRFRGKHVVIPDGFPVDGASVPRPLWSLFSPTGILLMPAIIHDFAYSEKGLLCADSPAGETEFHDISRTEADLLFRLTFVQANQMPVLSWVPYLALNLFGWPGWKSVKKRVEPPRKAIADSTHASA